MKLLNPSPTHNMAAPMEEGSEQVVAGSGTGSVSVTLHPLVVMNVSDHFTRVKVQAEDGNTTGK